MRELYRLLLIIYADPALDWRIAAGTGAGLSLFGFFIVPALIPWTGLFPLLIQSVLVIAFGLSGLAMLAYGGWLWFQANWLDDNESEDEDEDDGAFLESSAKPPGQTHSSSGAPDCPKCGGPMAVRQVRSGRVAGTRFWACSDYPDCRSLMPIKEE